MTTTGPVTVQLIMHTKWWFRPALVLAFIALQLGLIRDAESAEHYDGRITAEERVSKWLADFAFWVEVR